MNFLVVFMEPQLSVGPPRPQMPRLSSDFLQTHRELRLAHLALSMMTMGYIWQEGERNTVQVSISHLPYFPLVSGLLRLI